MDKIQKVIDESGKVYDENIKNSLIKLTDITGFDHSDKSLEAFYVAEKEIKDLIFLGTYNLLLALEQELESKRKFSKVSVIPKPGQKYLGVQKIQPLTETKRQYNKALTDIQTLLKAAKKEIK